MARRKYHTEATVIPKTFGSGHSVNHTKYGKGKCVGFVQGKYWRIHFDSGDVRDFLPAKLFSSLIN